MSALGNVEVRIRHIAEGRSIPLGRTEDIDGIIPLLRSWGLYFADNGDYATAFMAQFVLDHEDRQAYYEVIVGEDEE